jgi:hypothetical protein
MRYRESQQPAQEQPAAAVSTEMMVGTAVYSLLLGLAFVWFGLQGRQRWLAFWGATLSLAGLAYVVAVALGYE